MGFGPQGATVLGKTRSGYADGSGDAFGRRERPMARFLLDEPDQDGETSLTLDVSDAQYDRLAPGQHGQVSHMGRRLTGFACDSPPEPAEAPEADEASPAEAKDAASPAPDHSPEAPPQEMPCPWCGKAMGLWRMDAMRYGTVLKRGERWRFDKEKLKNWFRSGDFGASDEIRLSDGGKVLLYVCEDCQKAVIDYKNGACNSDRWI